MLPLPEPIDILPTDSGRTQLTGELTGPTIENLGGMMVEDRRRAALRGRAVELLAIEREIDEMLTRRMEAAQAYPEVAEVLEGIRATASRQRKVLDQYLVGMHGFSGPVTARTFSPPGEIDADNGVVGLLQETYTAVNRAAFMYGILTELAFRLYEPPLREVGPSHLRSYAEAAHMIDRLIAGIVAAELRQEGLECCCVCGMCSMGLCGCVSAASTRIEAAWRDASLGPDAALGFPLLPPRPNSELARVGVEGGERLLAIDDDRVRDHTDILAALRKHRIGDEVRLLTQRGSEPPREVRVRHVGDYPKGPAAR